MRTHTSDVAFSESVKQVQAERGSRRAYARMERGGGFESEISDGLRAFLDQVETAFLATASAEGQPYVQHRGGPPGFLRAIDAHTVAFVDLAGNRQYVSTGNLRENDRVCLLAMDYAHRRRVKLWGRAHVEPVTAAWLARLGHVPRGRPEQVVLIDVEAWDANCPQHIPQLVSAGQVNAELEALRARFAGLEAENAALRALTQT